MSLARKILGSVIMAGGVLTPAYFVYSEVKLGTIEEFAKDSTNEEHEKSKEIWRKKSFANVTGFTLGSLPILLGGFVYYGREER